MAKKKAESEQEGSLSEKKKAALKKKSPSSKVKTVKKAPKKVLKEKDKKKVTASQKQPRKKNDSNKTDKLQQLVDAIVEGMQEVKGNSITILDLRKINNRVTDYYVICHAESNTQVNAIADSTVEVVKKKTGERPYHTEGQQNAEWILLDFVNVVAHIFQTETRYFYNLESLWADADITKID